MWYMDKRRIKNDDITHEWVYYSDKDSPDFNICITEYREQKLRDFADNYKECIDFNTKGELKNKIAPLCDGCGIWIKEKIEYNSDTRYLINKDYNLPLITLVYIFNNNIDKIVDYLNLQLYLHINLVIIYKNDNISIIVKDLIAKNHNIETYINTDNKNIDTIMNELKYVYFLEIFDNKNYDYNYVIDYYNL